MSRIRTVKPEFFRHEGLQDLEAQHPGKYVMLVFAGLWTQCDCNGVFPWRPRQLKLDILPFLPFDMAESLEILRTSGQIHMYEVDGRAYGQVPTFHDHQRLSGKEAQGESRYPTPDRGKHQGSDCEAEGKRQDFPNAQERELEREREKKAETALLKPPPPPPPPKAPVNPFEAFGKDAMHDLAPSKTSELTMDVANNLVASGKFPEVHT